MVTLHMRACIEFLGKCMLVNLHDRHTWYLVNLFRSAYKILLGIRTDTSV